MPPPTPPPPIAPLYLIEGQAQACDSFLTVDDCRKIHTNVGGGAFSYGSYGTTVPRGCSSYDDSGTTHFYYNTASLATSTTCNGSYGSNIKCYCQHFQPPSPPPPSPPPLPP
jgi:hypothetical protein